MNVWRYQTSEQIEINAPIDQVYATASSPDLVPSYAPEIARIEIERRLSERDVLARSYLKVAGLTLAYLYRYHYRPPTHYSGVQERGRFLRGSFNLTFRRNGDSTVVSHTEGILSPIPCLAWLAGFVYFRIVARGGVEEEMGRLRHLIENRQA